MTLAGTVVALLLAAAAGRLVLWTSLMLGGAIMLEVVRREAGWASDYKVSALGLDCRGDVLVRGAGTAGVALPTVLRRLNGLEPLQAVQLLKAHGFRAELS
jgi:hypothetical protein